MMKPHENRPYIIAEIGFNHDGDPDLAVRMIHEAAAAGADAVKFQSFRAEDIALPSSPHYELIRKGEMDEAFHRRLFEAARSEGVDFLSTPFGLWAVDLLEDMGVKAYKIASMDCTNHHLLGRVAETKKALIISTGMASLAEIAETLHFLKENKSGPVTLLHCISLYPASPESLNLAIMPWIQKLFGCPVGFSDHYPGTEACLLAALLGASVIETHFTLDNTRKDGDHPHSVTPEQMKTLIETIERMHLMTGSAEAIHTRKDRSFKADYRRGVHLARDIEQDAIIHEKDLLFSRPASSLSPNDLAKITGKKTSRSLAAFTPLSMDDLKV